MLSVVVSLYCTGNAHAHSISFVSLINPRIALPLPLPSPSLLPLLLPLPPAQELVDAHVMFKDMDADPYLKSAGIASDWPCGRGCYQSADGGFIIWFGEEDQLRIMCMAKGFVLNDGGLHSYSRLMGVDNTHNIHRSPPPPVPATTPIIIPTTHHTHHHHHPVFDRLEQALKVVEAMEGIDFATSAKYGYVTSCPSNLGTGMRASVHVQVPNLTKDGTDTKAKAAAKPLGLSVRGMGGEHTPIGADGTIDLSPSNRLFITEGEIGASVPELPCNSYLTNRT